MKKLITLFTATITSVVCLGSCGRTQTTKPPQTSINDSQAETSIQATNDGFSDDYSDRSIVDYAEEMANDFMKDYFDSDQVIAFFKVNACDIEKKEVENGVFQWKLGVSDIIFVNEEICNADQVEEFAANYAKWLYEHELDGNHRINIIKDTDITKIQYNEIANLYDAQEYLGYYNFGFNSSYDTVLQFECLKGERNRNEFLIDEYFTKIK